MEIWSSDYEDRERINLWKDDKRKSQSVAKAEEKSEESKSKGLEKEKEKLEKEEEKVEEVKKVKRDTKTLASV